MIVKIESMVIECEPIEWIQFTMLMELQKDLFSGEVTLFEAQRRLDYAAALGPYIRDRRQTAAGDIDSK